MDNENSGCGCIVPTIASLTITFLILKLTHVVNWSWGWVLAPLWIPMIIFLLLIIIALIADIFK